MLLQCVVKPHQIVVHSFADLCNPKGITHEIVTVRVVDTAGDENVRGTHAYNLATASRIIFLKLIRLLGNLQKNTAFSKYQVRLGGDFPRHEYEE